MIQKWENNNGAWSWAIQTQGVEVQQQNALSEWETLASTTVAREADVSLSFTPSYASMLKLSIKGHDLDAAVGYIRYKRVDIFNASVVSQICNNDAFDDDYRFGFNGQMKDNEVKGIGNSLAFNFRIYDSRLGKFLSIDPLSKKFPNFSPYHFAGNSPIKFCDLEGKEIYITGTGQDRLVNMLAAATGANLSVGANGLLQYAYNTTIDPESGDIIAVPVLSNNPQASSSLCNLMLGTMDGIGSPVNMNALAKQNGAIPFDDFTTGEVDVTDYENSMGLIRNAQLAHVIAERAAGTGYDEAHNKNAMNAELRVIQEQYPTATKRNEGSQETFKNRDLSGFGTNGISGFFNDYGVVGFLNYSFNKPLPVSPANINNSNSIDITPSNTYQSPSIQQFGQTTNNTHNNFGVIDGQKEIK